MQKGAELLGSAVDNNSPSKRSDRPKQEERRVEANERWDDDECDMNGLVDGTANAWCHAVSATGLLWPAVSLAVSSLPASLSVSLSLSLPSTLPVLALSTVLALG